MADAEPLDLDEWLDRGTEGLSLRLSRSAVFSPPIWGTRSRSYSTQARSPHGSAGPIPVGFLLRNLWKKSVDSWKLASRSVGKKPVSLPRRDKVVFIPARKAGRVLIF